MKKQLLKPARCLWLLIFYAVMVNVYAQEQLNVQVISQATTPALPSNVFQRIEVDGKGHIWAGTNGQGIVKFNPYTQNPDSIVFTAFTTHQVRAITRDSKGDIWAGSAASGVQANTGAIRKFEKGNTNAVTSYNIVGVDYPIVSRLIYDLAEGPGGTMWAAHGQTTTGTVVTEGGLGRFDGEKWQRITAGLPASDRRVLAVGRVGDKVWAGVDRACRNGNCTAPYLAEYSQNGDFVKIVSEGLPFSNAGGALPRVIFNDSKGRVWVGLSTGTGVVAVYENDTWTVIDNAITQLPVGTAVNFSSIKEDRAGHIYVGTTAGLLKLKGLNYSEKSDWALYSTESGLPANFINGIALDDSGDMWLATSGGIVKVMLGGIEILDPNPELIDVTNGALLTRIDYVAELKTKRVGAATDGVTKLILRVKTDKKLTFVIRSIFTGEGTIHALADPGKKGTNTLEPVEVEPQVTSGGVSYVAVVYTAPESWGNNGAESKRSIKVEAYETDNPAKSEEVEIILKKAPVVLIHGMWSDMHAWKDGGFERYLKLNKYDNIQFADYSTDSYSTFDPNTSGKYDWLSRPLGVLALQSAISDGIDQYRKENIAVTQADVVAHSLGGLMTRSMIAQDYYVKNDYRDFTNFYEGTVHKLITLGTPHKGSPFGEFVWEKSFESAILRGEGGLSQIPVSQFFERFGPGKIGTVHKDFSPSSKAFQNLKVTKVKTHAIYSSYKPDATESYYALAALVRTLALNRTNHEDLFKEENDLIVKVSSQKGGLAEKYTTRFDSHIHSSIPVASKVGRDKAQTASLAVQSRVVALLQTNDTTLFAKSIPLSYDPAKPDNERVGVQAAPAHTMPANQRAAAATGYIQISTSAQGRILKYGSSAPVTLTVLPKEDAKIVSAVIMVEGIGILAVPETAPYAVTFNLPTNTPIGKVGVAALARDEDGTLMADTTSIYIQSDLPFINFEVVPGRVTLNASESKMPLFVSASVKVEQDTTYLNLTNKASGTTYTATKGIVRVSEDGLVAAEAVGSDVIEVKNGTNTYLVPVTVTAICAVIKPVITQNGNTLTSSSDAGNQWFLDNAMIVGATAKEYVATQSGSYTVRATVGCPGPMSDAVRVTTAKQEQAITFATIPDKTVGDAPFALAASTSSGLPVSYTLVSGPATLAGNVVTVTGEGTVTVKALQDGNEAYSPAPEVTTSFCVTPAKPAITESGNTLTSSSQTGNKWYRNATLLPGAMANTYTATEAGVYTVQVTGSCGVSAMSEALTLTITSAAEELSKLLLVYPNPAQERVRVELPDNLPWANLMLYSAQGKVVLQAEGNNKTAVILDVKQLPKGLYFLQIQTSKGVLFKKLMLE
ncbi:T9SS type A sorting domain-containing protein [Pontibacter qinzhouensis]|uniref:T9SS type A sorting domain-containing protein n=1 Tax=Pontibacter qinzhouensis TaxID=2603253 RepID=A0A5C8K9Z9_9BACT|nr:two-component regulator propeller domain-containing protein [Pontibacter qinzhouensis]TXK47434.1 T9SS type A sorting domain-containing protein [Pontibacter qinzhouensis]